MTSKLLLEICSLFVGLFIVGSVACLPAYGWNLKQFLSSRLWTKVYWWLPIFAVFCVVLFLRTWVAWVVVSGLVVQAGREVRFRQASQRWYVWGYVLLVASGLICLPLIFLQIPGKGAVHGLIAICFASVLSDVCAFFAGTYTGRHHLPAFINKRKSYEGVLGQIVGAVVGLALVAVLPDISFSWLLALAVGVASAVGDITNSVVKRSLHVPDWGDAIPGHGGVLDRFASLSFALAAGLAVLLLK